MDSLCDLLKTNREKKGLLLRQVASKIDVDTALISKIENNDRRPTKKQLQKLSKVLELDFNKLLTLWYAEKFYEDLKNEPNAFAIIKILSKKVKTSNM
ncbi:MULTISPECIES: helix-turn-helix domain-containing protein [Flagellimonas]|uniref:Helix-turn-helix domain-containing protein n=2 Tax=Flagellimonas TaxID=444459 RepID=A0A1H2RE13_9FLAO|nr:MULTISPECIES: helix-turn-helix transcriptional regulator [Allomuricauda]MDF0706245.1 helix-turn-helix transcriptional regulator [[Muricauda] okinawensis]SDQ62498.1 Helix-turn-helix [Allomuricauda zhangzhouensis]SDW17545.1 Helix-turn-helix domain-containing protein [Allomuricauda zhangzhouensis]